MRATHKPQILPFRVPRLLGLPVAAALLVSCSGPSGTTAGVADELSHIHSLDVNPADGTLYVASHEGLFALGPDGFSLVGEERFDAMSFTIADPDRFLISGHPEPGATGPVHLGLAESTDAGRTWQSISLEGEADFHTLEAVGERVYGVDSQSGQLMATDDGSEWRDLGQLPAADVASHPRRPDLLLLTDGGGSLFRLDPSSDRPQLVDAAPGLVLLDWVSEELLVGTGPEGTVYRSRDAGVSWQEVGSLPSAPHALTATDDRWYAATEDGVLVSEDAGSSWREVTDE